MVLYNADDAHAAAWADQADTACISYGLDAAEHVRAKRLSRDGGQQQVLAMTGRTLMPLTLKIPGDHVARAALAAVATGWMFDFSVSEAIAGIETLTCVPGRMQRIAQAVDVPVYIDDGETPDRLAVALHALRQHQLGPTTVVLDLSSRLDPGWRQRLGEVLDRSGSRVVLSASDLAPSAAQSVAMDVLGGFQSPGKVQVIPDRAAAIRWAVENTAAGCILLAGCGVNQWTGKSGELLSDERLAMETIASRNNRAPMPAFALFPPFDPNVVFPIDS
jgi:UDP-N-acetylmuramoyl-L-alanyl-D-glutamate--2,6-diaminopimelate ligase